MNRKSSKTTALSTLFVKVNWKYIINKSLDRHFWKNTFTIYECLNNKITMAIDSINVKRNQLNLRVFYIDKFGSLKDEYNYVTIPMDEAHYNETAFNNALCSAVRRIIKDLESEHIKSYREFELAKEADTEEENRLESIAHAFLDDNGVASDNIRDAYTDAYVSDNSSNYAMNVLTKYEEKVYTKEYLQCALYFGYKARIERYQKILENNSKNHRSYLSAYKDIKTALDNIKTVEFEEEMKSKLESL